MIVHTVTVQEYTLVQLLQARGYTYRKIRQLLGPQADDLARSLQDRLALPHTWRALRAAIRRHMLRPAKPRLGDLVVPLRCKSCPRLVGRTGELQSVAHGQAADRAVDLTPGRPSPAATTCWLVRADDGTQAWATLVRPATAEEQAQWWDARPWDRLKGAGSGSVTNAELQAMATTTRHAVDWLQAQRTPATQQALRDAQHAAAWLATLAQRRGLHP